MSVRVLLCGCEGPKADAVAAEVAALDVVDLAGLCRRPGRLEALAAGATNLVLGVCRDRLALGELQRAVRTLGLDPLGIEIVDARVAGGNPARLALILAAAVARAAAFAGTRPENAKPVMPEKISRRSFLTLSLPEYRAAPAVDEERCAAAIGCRLCVDACPQEALRWDEGTIAHDLSACVTCGICVTTCPTGAMVNPAITPAQLRAQVATLLDPDAGPPGPRGIVFTCRGGAGVETDPGWYPVEVACTGMVRAGWMLAPLAMGAGAVAVRRCSENGCPLGHDDLVGPQLEFGRALLGEWGGARDRLTFQPGGPVPDPLMRAELADPFAPGGTAQALVALAGALGVSGTERVVHPAAPMGVVEIDPGACTGCGMCVKRCPTGALAEDVRRDRIAITFDAAACVACGRCVGGCPEIEAGAIRLIPGADPTWLAAGPVELYRDEQVRCEVCGGPVAPAAMLARVRTMLGEGYEKVVDVVSRRCSGCRGVFPSEGSGQPSLLPFIPVGPSRD